MNGKLTKKGFTLFEMMIVCGILAMLASAAVPVAEISFNSSKETELEQSLEQIREAIALWKRDCRISVANQYGYDNLSKIPYHYLCPPTLEALVECTKGADGIWYSGTRTASVIKDRSGAQVATFTPKKYLKRIPSDPFVGRPCWLVHIAAGNADVACYGLREEETKAYTRAQIEAGTTYTPDASIDFQGVFDVSCIASNAVDPDDYYTRRGLNVSVDGTLFEDW